MICKNCGAINDDSVSACKACGTKVKADIGSAKCPPETSTLGSASVLDYNNPEEPKPDLPVTGLHYESRRYDAPPASYSHPRSYSPTYSVPTSYGVPAYGGIEAPAASFGEPDSGSRVISGLKALAKSPAMIVSTVAYSLCALCYLLIVFSINGLITATTDTLAMFGGYNSLIESGAGAGQLVIWIVAIVAFIPTLLTLIGLWITVGQGLTSENRIATAGMTIIKGVKIFEFVCFCISLLFSFFAFIGSDGFSSFRYVTDDLKLVFFAIFLLYIGYVVWRFFYYSALFNTIDSFRDSVLYRSPSGYPSVMVAVDAFLNAAGTIIALVFVFFTLSVSGSALDYAGGMTYDLLDSIKGAYDFFSFSIYSYLITATVASISFGIMAIIYKNRLMYIRYDR